MRIGIITYHRAFNYGAVLQCFALQELLKSMDHEIQVVDYRQPFIEKLYRPSIMEQTWQNKFSIKALLAIPSKIKTRNQLQPIFESFVNNISVCRKSVMLSRCRHLTCIWWGAIKCGQSTA